MQILVVSENYLQGGLEKHILALAEEGMARGDRFYFAFCNYIPCGVDVVDGNIACMLQYPASITVDALDHDVDALVQTIEANCIDAVHVHPFGSVLPAAIAAQKCGVPLIFTSHGPISYNFPEASLDALLFQHCLANVAAHIFTVNRKCLEGLATFFPETQVTYLPNPIVDFNCLNVGQRALSRKWALVSRLDYDKAEGVRRVLQWLPDLPIDELVVYGDGSARDGLMDHCDKRVAPHKVKWVGFRQDWLERLRSSDVMGVFGMDRVALEASAIGLPVVLLSADSNPCGVMDVDRYKRSKECNFGGVTLPKLTSARELTEEIEALEASALPLAILSELVKEDYSVQQIYDEYIKTVESCQVKGGMELVNYYQDLKSRGVATVNDNSAFQSVQRALLGSITNPLVFETYMIVRERIACSQAKASQDTCFANRFEMFAERGDELASAYEELTHQLEMSAKNGREAFREIEALRKQVKSTADTVEQLKRSHSWRIGRAVTAPVRYFRRLGKKK